MPIFLPLHRPGIRAEIMKIICWFLGLFEDTTISFRRFPDLCHHVLKTLRKNFHRHFLLLHFWGKKVTSIVINSMMFSVSIFNMKKCTYFFYDLIRKLLLKIAIIWRWKWASSILESPFSWRIGNSSDCTMSASISPRKF